MRIVTGYRGQPHISSNDQQGLNQGVVGSGNYVFDVGQKFSATLTDVNTVTISDGEGILQGVHFRIEPGESETANIANGSTGMKRLDLICARYTKNTITGIEDVQLVVIQGEEDDTEATAPDYNEGDILTGDTIVDFPIYEVSLDGLTPTLTALFVMIAPSYTFGTDGIWTYRKYGDGLYHAWYEGAISLGAGTAMGGGYYHISDALEEPSFSKSVTSLRGSANGAVLYAYVGCNQVDHKTYWWNNSQAAPVSPVYVRLDMYGTW